uniref:C2H2-type domain-containing protein n=1 Tax=Monopterus albus TaxID=43700 RepID=A0A3Q3JVZ4_MONAL
MLNSGLTTESEPPSEAAPKQLDFPLTNIKTELDSSLTDNPRPRRDRKLPRKYTPAQPKDCLISYLKGLRSFNRWNKLWLHRRFHRQTHRPFSCAQCDLEFRFLGSYIDHLQEHAAQMPYACPLCPDTFANNENLTVHISESHKLQDFNKCSKCGKNFSTLRNLKKHKLLHKGATSHFCLPCNLSFSSHSALKTHLKTHRVRLNTHLRGLPVQGLLQTLSS